MIGGSILSDADLSRALTIAPVEAVIHCAAFVDVDRAEADEPTALAVNADASANVAAAAAMLGAMAARPALAQLVMGDAITVEPAIVERYRGLILPAIEGLWKEADKPERAYADPRLAFGRAQVLIFSQIAAGRTARLPDLLPEIVYIALLPYAGHDEAVRQAQMASDGPGSDGPAQR